MQALHAADRRCAGGGQEAVDGVEHCMQRTDAVRGVGKDGFFVPGAAGMRHCMQQTESNARGGNQPVEEGILLA